MKKARIIAVMAALIVSLSGCANTDYPQTIQDSSCIETVASRIDERTEPEDSSAASVSESKESSADMTVKTENSQPTVESNPAAQTQPTQPTVSNDTPEPKPPKTVKPTLEPKSPQQPTQPQAEEKPTPEPTPTESPQETAPPEEPAPDFNIDYWIGYARSYAESVGLRLESTAVDCWDNPITAGAYSACLDRDIESRLNRYSRDEDITDVWIWAQARSDGSYDLYIGYA